MPDLIAIYHNPKCGASVKVLALLRARGVEPTIIEYLKTPPTAAQWKALVAQATPGLGIRDFLRTKEKLYTDLDLANPKWTDAQLLAHLTAHPQLLNRPVVATSKGARPCRPVETVLELLS